MSEKVKGTVKWFSPRKGFGFIKPTSDNAPTKDDIFVHQQSIVTLPETYRTLKDGFEVEFEVGTDSDGKLKAENVTSSDGSPCPGPEPRERRRRRKKKASAANGESDEVIDNDDGVKNANEKTEDTGKDKEKAKEDGKANGAKINGAKTKAKTKTETKSSWYTELEDGVKEKLKSLGIIVESGKAFIAIGDARIKLGTGGYTAFVHACGLIAEGTFNCDKKGTVVATWSHVLKYDGSEWKPSNADTEKEELLTTTSLLDDSIKATTGGEPVWGDEKEDPREALKTNGFQIRSVVFHHSTGRRRRGRGRRKRTKKGGE